MNINEVLDKAFASFDAENAAYKLNELKWHKRFLELAIVIANWSKDPSSKVGAVIVDKNRRIVSTGYNGFPIGVKDLTERLDVKEIKYKMVLHAEENAIMFARRDLSDCTLYVSKIPPCSHCAGLIIQSGIKQVYVQKCEISDRWKESIEYSKIMFKEASVTLNVIDIEYPCKQQLNNFKNSL